MGCTMWGEASFGGVGVALSANKGHRAKSKPGQGPLADPPAGPARPPRRPGEELAADPASGSPGRRRPKSVGCRPGERPYRVGRRAGATRAGLLSAGEMPSGQTAGWRHRLHVIVIPRRQCAVS